MQHSHKYLVQLLVSGQFIVDYFAAYETESLFSLISVISEQKFKTLFIIWWQWLLGADKSLMTFECLTHAEMEFNAVLLCSRW